MATYLILGNYTTQGVQHIKERGERAERLRKRCQEHGCALKAGYLALGRYDMALIIEAPSEAAIATVMLGACMNGAVRTETLRVFDEAESNAIIAAI